MCYTYIISPRKWQAKCCFTVSCHCPFMKAAVAVGAVRGSELEAHVGRVR